MQFPGWKSLDIPKVDRRWLAVCDVKAPPAIRLRTPREVHAYVRRKITYAPDPLDLWQEPAQTLASGRGDCEDYAILERALLIASGWPSDDIWMVIARDLIARQDHAFLVADQTVLDCRTDALTPLRLIADYRPILAFCDHRAVTFGRVR